MRRNSPAAHLAAHLVCRSFLFCLSLLPRRAGHAIGRVVGLLFFLLSPRHRRTAIGNLKLIFGDQMGARECGRIARASFAHLGMIFADAAYFKRLMRLPIDRVAVYEGVEHLVSAAAEGRGVLVFSGHFGHWELVALLQHRLGVPMSMVVRPLENARLDALLTRLRMLTGNSVIPKRDAARGVMRALRAGRSVALLIDQNVRGAGGVFLDFLGVPASTTPSLAIYALKCGAPIVPVFSYPMADGRLRIAYGPPLRAIRRGTLAEDILATTRACTTLLETEVRRHPEVWLWMHGRWRTRPDAPRSEGAQQPRRATASSQGVASDERTQAVSRVTSPQDPRSEVESIG